MVCAQHKILVAKKQKGKRTEKDSCLLRQLSVYTVNDKNLTPFYMVSEDGPLEFKLSFQIYSSIFYLLKFVSFLDAHSFKSCVFIITIIIIIIIIIVN